jgi:anti-anti-sigma factor
MLGPMSFDPLFKVRYESREGGVVVIAGGEIDLASSPQLRKALLDQQASVVVLDLRAVTFIDSSGLGVIVGQQKRARENGKSFAVVTAGASAVERILELSGLVRVLDIIDDPSERLPG